MANIKSLHISMNIACSDYRPSNFLSSFTHLSQVFLLLPLHFTPVTSTLSQANTQSCAFLSPNYPNHGLIFYSSINLHISPVTFLLIQIQGLREITAVGEPLSSAQHICTYADMPYKTCEVVLKFQQERHTGAAW